MYGELVSRCFDSLPHILAELLHSVVVAEFLKVARAKVIKLWFVPFSTFTRVNHTIRTHIFGS